jgi:hypothetical protein
MDIFDDAITAIDSLLSRAARKLVYARRNERYATSEEELHDAQCNLSRAEEDYEEAIKIHRLVLNLIQLS